MCDVQEVFRLRDALDGCRHHGSDTRQVGTRVHPTVETCINARVVDSSHVRSQRSSVRVADGSSGWARTAAVDGLDGHHSRIA